MFVDIVLISIALISLAFLGMALNILIKKKGKFPAYQVGHNKNMARMGISCVKHDEIKCHKELRKGKPVFEACATCEHF